MKLMWTILGTVVIGLSLACCTATAEETVKADRTPLTFRDSGLYCNYNFWHVRKPAEDGVTNMLPPERAATDKSPWTFYIMQYWAPDKPREGYDGAAIRQMAKNGKKVILRAGIGRMEKNPDVDKMEQHLINMFKEVDPDLLYAITLDEEQIFWNGWNAALTELYHRCKKRWPDLPVYQWWSPMQHPDVRAKSGWIELPADGWVIDLYGQPRVAFEKKVVKSLETGKPLIHIVWASPDWPDHSGAKSWDEGGRKIFDDQLEICRGYNVPVAYFCTQKYEMKDGKRVAPIRWGWHAVKPEVRQWYRQLETMAMNLRNMPADQIGFRALDEAKFNWAHGSPQPVRLTYQIDDKGRKQFNWRSVLQGVSHEPGEHAAPTPYDNPYVKVTCVLDKSASALGTEFGIASTKGYPVRVPLIFKVEPKRPLSDLSVTAGLYTIKELGGHAKVSSSMDGKTWSDPLQDDPEQREQELTVSSPASGYSDEPLYVRVLLEAVAGSNTNTCSSLSWLEVSAAFEEPLGQ